jgi:hypothetical protein
MIPTTLTSAWLLSTVDSLRWAAEQEEQDMAARNDMAGVRVAAEVGLNLQ